MQKVKFKIREIKTWERKICIGVIFIFGFLIIIEISFMSYLRILLNQTSMSCFCFFSRSVKTHKNKLSKIKKFLVGKPRDTWISNRSSNLPYWKVHTILWTLWFLPDLPSVHCSDASSGVHVHDSFMDFRPNRDRMDVSGRLLLLLRLSHDHRLGWLRTRRLQRPTEPRNLQDVCYW